MPDGVPLVEGVPRPLKHVGRFDKNLVVGAIVVIVIGAFTLVPILYVLISSFNVAAPSESFRFGLDGWAEIVGNPKTWRSIVTSFVLAARVPIAVVVAFAICWLLIRADIPGSRIIEMTLWFGFFLPAVPMVMGWILLLDDKHGLLNLLLQHLSISQAPVFSANTIPSIMWVHLSLSTVPVMTILLSPAFRQLDASFEEAAEVSGSSIYTTLRRVTIPLLLPAIMTSFIAAFIRSLETFEVEQILGTPAGISVYGTRIYDLVQWEPPLLPQAMALSTIFLALLLAMAGVYHFYLIRAGSRPTIGARAVRLQARGRSPWAYVATGVIALYIGVSIVLPFTMLVLGSFNRLFGFFTLPNPWTASHWISVLSDDRFVRATINSVTLGLLVGVLGILLFALISWVLVRSQLWGKSVMGIMIWLPWSIPGIVLGVTLLSLFLNVPILRSLTGTIVPLIVALLIQQLPIGVQLMRSSLDQISGQLEEAASVSGAGFVTLFRRITLPLIAPTLISLFLLTFAATIRDISTIVLVASPGMRTLSLVMFDYATSGKFEASAVLGVIVAVISLLTTIIAYRFGLRRGVAR